MNMANQNSEPQSEHYGQDYDYLEGSPHLRHRHLYEALTSKIVDTLGHTEAGETPEVLEVGAGDGSVSERLLSKGYRVTATEMSAESVRTMARRFGSNDRFRVLEDAGDMKALGDSKFDAILFASVVHHIPDYLSALGTAMEGFLKPGGALVTIQDPLWYPRLKRGTKVFSDASYLSWRLTKGNLTTGLRTRWGRVSRGMSEEAPGDVVEYHVVRDGVDEEAILRLLEPRFERVDLFSYWSSQGTIQQRIGERLGLANTFGVFASGFRD